MSPRAPNYIQVNDQIIFRGDIVAVNVESEREVSYFLNANFTQLGRLQGYWLWKGMRRTPAAPYLQFYFTGRGKYSFYLTTGGVVDTGTSSDSGIAQHRYGEHQYIVDLHCVTISKSTVIRPARHEFVVECKEFMQMTQPHSGKLRLVGQLQYDDEKKKTLYVVPFPRTGIADLSAWAFHDTQLPNAVKGFDQHRWMYLDNTRVGIPKGARKRGRGAGSRQGHLLWQARGWSTFATTDMRENPMIPSLIVWLNREIFGPGVKFGYRDVDFLKTIEALCWQQRWRVAAMSSGKKTRSCDLCGLKRDASLVVRDEAGEVEPMVVGKVCGRKLELVQMAVEAVLGRPEAVVKELKKIVKQLAEIDVMAAA